jgi:MFS transporter, ACS family, hexuronate transporter
MESTTQGVRRSSMLAWAAIGVFVLMSALNYLDRQLIAAAAPSLKDEFRLSNADYGRLLGVFALVYGISAPFGGLLIDRVGLRLGAAAAVILWSIAGAMSGLVQSFQALLVCRIGLALGESAAIPLSTKATATYLTSRELGLGTAVQSAGISVGSIAAPLLFAATAPQFGWRVVFLFTGALGLLWVPLWLLTAKYVPPRPESPDTARAPVGDILSDRRLWGVVIANALVMALYSLWLNWTTIYLVQEHHMTPIEANQRFAWIPPACATLGGLTGGFLAFRGLRRGGDQTRIRLRICWYLTPLLLVGAAVPFASSPGLASAAIAVSVFTCLAVVNNLQMIPIALFGVSRAGFTSAMLACSFALMQAVTSPVIGAMVDTYGFASVCIAVSILPIAGVGLLAIVTRPMSVPVDRFAGVSR